MDDDKGTSLVLVQSEAGQRIFEQIRNICTVNEVMPEQAAKQNPSMLFSSKANRRRTDVLKAVRNGDFEICRAILVPDEDGFFVKIKRKVSHFLHSII